MYLLERLHGAPEVFKTLDVLGEGVLGLVVEVAEFEYAGAAGLVEEIAVLLLHLIGLADECILDVIAVKEDGTNAVLLFDLIDLGLELEKVVHLLLDLMECWLLGFEGGVVVALPEE